MKIGMLTSSMSRCAGGVYEAMRWLARTLYSPPEYQVEIFGLRDEYTRVDIMGWGSLTAHTFDIKGPPAFGYAPHLTKSLISADLDLLHVHGLWMYPSVACTRWAHITARPYVISPHGMLDSWALKNSQWKKTLAKIVYEDRNLRGAACIQAGSIAEYQAIREAGLRNPICILPNGIHLPDELTEFSPPPWGGLVDEHSKTLLYLGRLHPKKGLNNLLYAWKLATQKSNYDKWNLIVAGVGAVEYENELKNLCVKLDLSSSVHFIGPQYHEAKLASYRAAAAFILPSFSEGMPMVVLDAWSYGLPVLMTPQCNLSFAFDANAALQIEPEIESVSQGLSLLFSLPDNERQALGNRGKLLAKENFCWDAITAQMRTVYAWLLNKGDKPKCVVID